MVPPIYSRVWAALVLGCQPWPHAGTCGVNKAFKLCCVEHSQPKNVGTHTIKHLK